MKDEYVVCVCLIVILQNHVHNYFESVMPRFCAVLLFRISRAVFIGLNIFYWSIQKD